MKNFFTFLSLFFFIHNISIIEKISEIKFITTIMTQQKEKATYFFAHNKFCKVLNFKLAKKKKDTLLEIKILLFDDGNKDFTLKQKNETLNSSKEFYILLKNNLNQKYFPIEIEQIEPTLEDELLFGKEYIKFGNLFKINFQDNNNSNNYYLELYQPDKLIIAEI